MHPSPSRGPAPSRSLRDKLTSPGWVLLPLRGFLGATFVFAGLDKIASPAFFDPSSPSSIQAQIAAAQRNSPVHGLLAATSHAAVPIGVLLALGELAAGIGTLLGLWSRVAAAGGMLISLMLFLTVSFHSHPYFTGSDIAFLFAWTPLVLAGSGGVLSVDAALAERAQRNARLAARPGTSAEMQRRVFLARATGAAAALGLLLAGIVTGIGRSLYKPSLESSTPSLRPGGPSPTPSTTPPSTAPAPDTPTSTSTTSPPPSGTPIGLASRVPVGGAAAFQDPSTGDPAYAVQPRTGQFVAFDAVCPHAGCTVGVSDKTFLCPCHGSQFILDTGAVLVGPATTGLQPIRVVRGSDGQLYAQA